MRLEATQQRFRDLVRLLQSEEYFAVASEQRFRAVERRLSWQASRVAMLVIALGAPVHIAVLSLFHPADAAYIAIVDGGLGAVALGAWWSLGRGLRHWPEPVAFVLSLAVAGMSMLLAVTGPQLVELTIGYLLFLPTFAALVLPWRSWTEIRWLAVYGICVTIFFATFAPDGELAADDRRDLIFALLVALAGAFTGHVLLWRYRVRSFVQVQALGRLQRHESRQRVELERVYRSLEVTARTDQLTGTSNRLKLDEDLRAARARLTRTGASFGLLEVDLDHFKGINDAFGHLAGDDVLRQVARAMRDAVRSDDALYRYGGEEFLIILGVVPGGVQAAGERVRRAVQDLGLGHPSNPPFGRVTVSVGAAEIDPIDAARTNEEWFGRVDAALYRAKEEGRNRVAVAPVSASIAPEPPSRAPTSTVVHGRATADQL
jgi:diguanylate cyclase (GGDEF)-like protein